MKLYHDSIYLIEVERTYMDKLSVALRQFWETRGVSDRVSHTHTHTVVDT